MSRCAIFWVAALTFIECFADVTNGHPERIVSLNLCTDISLIQLVPPEQIAGISFIVSDPRYSPVVDQAQRLPLHHGKLEEVIAEGLSGRRKKRRRQRKEKRKEKRAKKREQKKQASANN